MKVSTEITYAAASTIALTLMLTACSKQEESEAEISHDMVVASQSQYEKYELAFKRLVADSEMRMCDVERELDKICCDLVQMPDKTDALRLCDRLAEIAIKQQIVSGDYHMRENEFHRLFSVSLGSLIASMRINPRCFDCWDRMFKFFVKYTDEIKRVEKEYCRTDCKEGVRPFTKRYNYLLGLRGDFGLWLHVMRDLYFPRLSKGLTEEQKADILRRFDELQKYTAEPPK